MDFPGRLISFICGPKYKILITKLPWDCAGIENHKTACISIQGSSVESSGQLLKPYIEKSRLISDDSYWQVDLIDSAG